MTSTISFRVFSSLDDGMGYAAVEQILDTWQEQGIENSQEILKVMYSSVTQLLMQFQKYIWPADSKYYSESTKESNGMQHISIWGGCSERFVRKLSSSPTITHPGASGWTDVVQLKCGLFRPLWARGIPHCSLSCSSPMQLPAVSEPLLNISAQHAVGLMFNQGCEHRRVWLVIPLFLVPPTCAGKATLIG